MGTETWIVEYIRKVSSDKGVYESDGALSLECDEGVSEDEVRQGALDVFSEKETSIERRKDRVTVVNYNILKIYKLD